MSDLDDIVPIADQPQPTSIGCPVCRNGLMLPPEFNLPSVQCPTCGAVFGRLTGQVISGPMAPPMPMPGQGYYRSPPPPGMSGAPRGAAPALRARQQMPREPGMSPPMLAALVFLGILLASFAMWGVIALTTDDKELEEAIKRERAGAEEEGEAEEFGFAAPRKEWFKFRDPDWGVIVSFPTQFETDRDTRTTEGPQLRVQARDESGEYTLRGCFISPAQGREITADLRGYAERRSGLSRGESEHSRRPESIDGRAGYRITTEVSPGKFETVLVLVDDRNLYQLNCSGHESFDTDAERFFGSFRLLKSKFAASTPPSEMDRPLMIYFIGSERYTPGDDYHAVLVARNGDTYKWTILQDSLPKGIEAYPNDDRVVIQGRCDAVDGAGVLKLRVTSGDQAAEYELALTASRVR